MQSFTRKRHINFRHLILLFLIPMVLHSCRDQEDDKQKTENETLVSYQKVSSIPAQNIQGAFSLISIAYPEIAKLNFSNLSDVEIYKVKYKTSLNNKEVIASGLVCIPKKAGNYPIISFQNGTNTSNSGAPSQNITNEQFALLENLSGMGYIVTIPDYIGFGESNNILHPYYHRESSDSSVINLVKACLEILTEQPTGATSNGKLMLLGYSQGGWATLSAFKTLEENNTTGLEPVAASCGAGAYNLNDIAKHILSLNTYNSPAYLPYFIESHMRNGLMNTGLTTYFNQTYADKIPALFDGQKHIGSINSALNDTISRLMTAEMIQGFANDSQFADLREELLENSVDAWNVKGKLLFVHGKSDTTVPAFESENMVAKFRALGVDETKVQLALLDGSNHGSGVLPWAIKSLVWMDGMK